MTGRDREQEWLEQLLAAVQTAELSVEDGAGENDREQERFKQGRAVCLQAKALTEGEMLCHGYLCRPGRRQRRIEAGRE